MRLNGSIDAAFNKTASLVNYVALGRFLPNLRRFSHTFNENSNKSNFVNWKFCGNHFRCTGVFTVYTSHRGFSVEFALSVKFPTISGAL